MSPRDCFWFLAGALVTVAVMVALRPWLRQRPVQAVRPAIPAFAVPVAAALALVGVALGIYFLLGPPDSMASARGAAAVNASPQTEGQDTADHSMSSSTSAGSLDDVTKKLAARLATQGGSDSEWQLLAESYDYMGKTADAKAARAHITSSGSNAGSAPTPGSNIDSQTMAAVAGAFDTPSAAATTADSAPATRTSSGGTPDAGNAEISGTVELTPKLASRAQSGATLFIYAKQQPNTPGPPLAVVRLHADRWPVKFTLSDANAMVPGHNLSNAQTVEIEARISRNGDALPQSGDLVGSVTSVSPRGGHPVKISIDREIG
jgi:hypothetical protein